MIGASLIPPCVTAYIGLGHWMGLNILRFWMYVRALFFTLNRTRSKKYHILNRLHSALMGILTPPAIFGLRYTFPLFLVFPLKAEFCSILSRVIWVQRGLGDWMEIAGSSEDLPNRRAAGQGQGRWCNVQRGWWRCWEWWWWFHGM